MHKTIGIVDLFSGPGGLGEGFAAFSDAEGNRPYSICVSIEKEPSAHATMRLRSFLRKFKSGFPPEYYDFLNTEIEEPDWSELYPEEWKEAIDEARCLELGKEETTQFLDERVSKIRAEHDNRTILIGGPPCQAYSLVGRSRNAGIADYVPHKDDRHFLYEQYVSVLAKLKPAAFVMENVKGMLSSAVKGDRIFLKVLSDLRGAAGPDSYQLYALSSSDGTFGIELDPEPSDFVVRSENYGVPQARHRVIIIGLRKDVAEDLPVEFLPHLVKREDQTTVHDMIGAMPPLRSGLSRGDSAEAHRAVLKRAVNKLKTIDPPLKAKEKPKFHRALVACSKRLESEWLPRISCGGATVSNSCPSDLREFVIDEKLDHLPNNETRGHMPSDLERYLFASAFGVARGRSPKSSEFPLALAPNHKNWLSGNFADRFRVQIASRPASTVTSHISKDGHYYIHPDSSQCRSLTVREAARLQTFPDNYYFKGNRTQQYVQVGNAVPPFLAHQIAESLSRIFQFIERRADSEDYFDVVRPETA